MKSMPSATGVIPDFALSSLVAGADRSRKMDIQMMVWLLKGSDGRNILVDSGFYREKFFPAVEGQRFHEAFGSRRQVRRQTGRDQRHHHHAYALGIMPTAWIFSRRRECGFRKTSTFTTRAKRGRRAIRTAALNPDDVMALVKLNIEGPRQARQWRRSGTDQRHSLLHGRETYVCVAVREREDESRNGDRRFGQYVPLRKPGQACADCADAGCGFKPQGARSDEATRLRSAIDCAGTTTRRSLRGSRNPAMAWRRSSSCL